MSSLTGKSLNPVMNRRSVIASAAGLGAMSILAGCSSNGGDSGSASGDASFKIGTIGPLTGANASYGKSVTQGVELGCKDFSTKELPLASKAEDDQADGEKAVNAYNTMMDNGMQVLVGPTTTGASIAVANACYNDRTFMLTPSASSTDVTAGKDNVFQVCFTDPNQGVSAADYMAENFAGAKVAIIYRNDDAYSQGIRDAFVKEATDKGAFEVVYQGTFTNDTASDFSVQLAGAQNAGADLVFLPIYYQPASIIFSQAKAMGYAPTFFGVDGMDGILTMPGFDASLAEGLMLMTPFSATDEANQAFVDAYTAAYSTEPNQFAADAYDCVYALKLALETAGCTPDMSNEEICDALVSAFQSLTFDGLTGTGATWSAEGAVTKDPTVVVIKDGKYVNV